MRDNDKITLTIGQIKKLINESRNSKVVSRVIEYYDDEFEDDITETDVIRRVKASLRLFGFRGIKVRVISINGGPEGGWPVVELTGNAENVDNYIMESMDMDQEQLEEYLSQFKENSFTESRILKEYEIDDNGYDDEGNYGGPWAKYDWERRHGRIWSDPDEETPYSRRRKHGKWWPNARGDMPGYGDPETWGGREPH